MYIGQKYSSFYELTELEIEAPVDEGAVTVVTFTLLLEVEAEAEPKPPVC